MNKSSFFSILLLCSTCLVAQNETSISSEDINHAMSSAKESISNAASDLGAWITSAPGKIKEYLQDKTVDFANLPDGYHAIIFKNEQTLIEAAKAAGYSVQSVSFGNTEYAMIITDSSKTEELQKWING